MTIWIEPDCVFSHCGKEYSNTGAVITDANIVAYPDCNGILKSWHGDTLGTWRTVATWPTPNSWVSSTMSQIEATVNGIVYTGRGAGIGMIFKGKRKVIRSAV